MPILLIMSKPNNINYYYKKDWKTYFMKTNLERTIRRGVGTRTGQDRQSARC